MPEIVTKVEASLQPDPGTTHTDLTFQSQTFAITVAGRRVTALPLHGIAIDPETASAALEREIAPFLAVISADLQAPVELTAPVPSSVDPADLGAGEKHRPMRFTIDRPFTIEGATYKSDFATRVRWAQADPIYRDLCDLLAAAETSPNPRPEAFKMVERLEEKFGTRA